MAPIEERRFGFRIEIPSRAKASRRLRKVESRVYVAASLSRELGLTLLDCLSPGARVEGGQGSAVSYDRSRDQSNRIFVGGLTDGIVKEDLEREFSKYGKLNHVWVAQNPPGFAFIEFDDERDASEACNEMNGANVNGCTLRVEPSRGRRSGGRGGPRGGRGGGGGGGGGFRGGRGGFGGSRGGGYRGGRDSYGDRSRRGGYGGGGNNGGRDFGRRDGGGRRDNERRYRSRSPVSQR
ncbi:RNA-binding protein Rsf1-like [Galendromus occidentalis]|uniref:RNA-binding protein Rsf1-like n=1 Tax=Galendromus occidentalis TaxID=34638 RepID=A0AAJ6W0R8_9ACAR|nr:RNA-binding protein Rsf1-like [Galendromus occidentalis]